MDDQAIREEIWHIALEELDRQPDELSDAADLVDDIDADSLSMIQILARIERELKISIPQEEFIAASTLHDIYALASKYRRAIA